MFYKVSLLSVILVSFISCGNSSANVVGRGLPEAIDTVSFNILGEVNNHVLTVKDTIDLANRKCSLPSGISLSFKGGFIQNGILEGNMTRLKSGCKPCFNRVKIEGTWNVPVIKSSLFNDLGYDNALKDVIALSNPGIKNKIIIKEGFYKVSALRNTDNCLTITSNTELILDGTIQLTPNGFRCYNIVTATGENIRIKGKGIIIGDKHTHTGTDGEWGMGIMVNNGHNVNVCGLTVKDCWGDCIYVGNESTDVVIEKCKLDNGRRQGISITSADGVLIKNCEITNVSGTLPEFAIDVEPNKNDTVDNVYIDHIICSNCKGGVKAVSYASNAKVGKVEIHNSIVTSEEHEALKFVRCAVVIVGSNIITRTNSDCLVLCKHIGQLKVNNNSLKYFEERTGGLITNKRVERGVAPKSINVVDCENSIIRNNNEIIID